MLDIANYLQKYRKLEVKDAVVKTTLKEILQRMFGARIETTEIAVDKGTVHIKANPYLKTKIFTHKRKILERANSVLGSKKIRTIF